MNHIRHMNIFDAANLSVVLIGAGGIGAMTALTLAKMGVGYLEIYDDDIVSPENLATQLHKLSDVGTLKVEALSNTLLEYADDTHIFTNAERITHLDNLSGQIIISAVDSISARQDIWSALKHFRYYIDARMGAEKAEIYIVTPDKFEWYSDLISNTSDDDFAPVACTEKSTFFCASGIAGLLGELVRKIASNEPLPNAIAFDFRTFTCVTM